MQINLIAPTDHQIKLGDVYYYILEGKVYETTITELPTEGATDYKWTMSATLPTTHYLSKRTAELEVLRLKAILYLDVVSYTLAPIGVLYFFAVDVQSIVHIYICAYLLATIAWFLLKFSKSITYRITKVFNYLKTKLLK